MEGQTARPVRQPVFPAPNPVCPRPHHRGMEGPGDEDAMERGLRPRRQRTVDRRVM